MTTAANSDGKQVGGTHYKDLEDNGKQHWDIMWEVYGEAWFVGNITKYVSRYKVKDGLKDLGKAMHYAEKLCELSAKDPKKLLTYESRYSTFCLVRNLLHVLITMEKDIENGHPWNTRRDVAREILALLIPEKYKMEDCKTPSSVKDDIDFDGQIESTKRAEARLQSPSEKSFRQIQEEIGKWAYTQFGDNSSKDVDSISHGHPLGPIPPLLGMGEELGELNRVVLRKHQGRGLPYAAGQEAKADALADMLVYMCDFSTRENIDLQSVLNKVWEKVQKRTQQNWEADKAKESVGEILKRD